MSDFSIEPVGEVTPELVQAISSLMPQLGTSPAPGFDELVEIVTSASTTLFVSRCDSRIIGMVTLILVRIPTGVRAIIEDVVVDDLHRGKGIGEALTRAALERARVKGAKRVDLTSRPSRHAAHRLYRRLGFEIRDTGIYRFSFDP
jgi:ribosomal protein S18 acetylase RimI-like enzyme